jgi:hypothetical protein
MKQLENLNENEIKMTKKLRTIYLKQKREERKISNCYNQPLN